jgi:DNA repair exonuclease SbcCD ATPase subunit
VDLNYELLNVNKSVSDFTGEKDLPKFIGSKCFKLVFNNESICEWCRVNDVIEKKKSICQHIKINKDGKELVYEHTMYPIFDENGEVIEIGEYLNDITEQYNLVENLKKSREQIHKISREKIQSINEISSLRAEYNSLLEMYEEAQSKIQKLSIALQKVLEQSTVNEVLKLKSENKNLKSRIDRLENSVENYKKLIDNENSKLSESIVKSVYSLERLINMVDKKKKIEDKDLKNIHDFLNNEVNLLKKYIKSKEESTDGNKSGN